MSNQMAAELYLKLWKNYKELQEQHDSLEETHKLAIKTIHLLADEVNKLRVEVAGRK